MSPIHDPDSPQGRRLTRLASRLDGTGTEKQKGRKQRQARDGAGDLPGGDPPASPPSRPESRSAGGDEARPRFDPARALDGGLDDEPSREKHGRRRRSPRTRQRAAAPSAASGPARPAEDPPLMTGGLVVATTRGPCEVELDDGKLVLAHLPKAMARAERSQVAVGDRVRVASRSNGEFAVEQIEERRTRLSRPDPFLAHVERVLAANIDLAVIVVSLRSPPLVPGLIDRFLVALEHGGIDALIAINKIDLYSSAATESGFGALEHFRANGVAMVRCSARTAEGLEELRSAISGRTVVFVGHSGVGKSSLLNALLPDAGARTGAVAANRRRGRHTTSRSRIYRLDHLGETTRIIDTPGIREFGLWQMSGSELAAYFADFEPFAAACRFSDCSHLHEPGCAVRAAVATGDLAAERLATYLRILESLTGD